MTTLSSEQLLPSARHHPMLSVGLAVLVHLLLAALLLWGFRWEIPQPKPVQVELWSAPAAQARSRPLAARPVPPARQAVPDPAPEPLPEPPAPAEINRRVQEKLTVKQPEKVAEKLPAKVPPKAALEKTASSRPKPETKAETRHIPQPTDEDEVGSLSSGGSKVAEKSQAGANSDDLLQDYIQQVSLLLRSRVMLPQDPPGNPIAEFRINVLSSMVIFDREFIRRSGDPQWDSAAEKAILLSKQLPPLPPGLNYGPQLRTMRIKLCPQTCR